MPFYRFQCLACGLEFQSRVQAGSTSCPCSGCGAEAQKDLPKKVNVGFSVRVETQGPTTTGYAGMDYNADRAIGEYSKGKWGEIANRQKDKISYLQQSGATGFDLSRNPDGTYRVMSPEERAASERSRKFHFNMLRLSGLKAKSTP
jgi:hypothetical protein